VTEILYEEFFSVSSSLFCYFKFFFFISRNLISVGACFGWHYIPECVKIIKILQHVSQLVTVQVQTHVNCVNVNATFSGRNAISDQL
jgi:hypothetical protein